MQAGPAPRPKSKSKSSKSSRVTFSDLGRLHKHEMFEDDEEVAQRSKAGPAYPLTPAKIVARLLFARLFDGRPDVLGMLRTSSAPVITIDVAAPDLLDRVLATWKDVLFPADVRVMNTDRPGKRDDYDAIFLPVARPQQAKEKGEREKEALSALALALPFIAISPAAESYLPSVVLKSAPIRLVLPSLDARTIGTTIRIVTGKRCLETLNEDTARLLSVTDLTIGIRFDRTAEECVSQLKRLAELKRQSKPARDITLDGLHGMSDAVAWSRSTIKDLISWKRGELPWSQIDAGAALEGPSGCGKTTLPMAMCRSAAELGIQLELASCSYSQFQGSGDGHLGHFLREMTNFFASARAKPRPVLVFIDEVDSFADRSKVRHSHADYVTAVVNGFISECDGISGGRDRGAASSREGLILLGASNDLSRCDPAILRSGRLNRVIRIGLPNLDELERMYRFRLGGRLHNEDLHEICLLSVGCVGADVERIVKDASRRARHASRDLHLADLRHAVAPEDDSDHEQRWRIAVHEAGHILMDVLNFGCPEGVFATVAIAGERGGTTVRMKGPPFAGTYTDYRLRLEVLVAGRTAERLLFSEHSHGAGGRRGSDLHLLTKTAAAMVGSLGLAGPEPLLFLASLDQTDELLMYPDVRRAAHEEIRKASDSCLAKLEARLEILKETAVALIEKRRIDGVAVGEMLSPSSVIRP